MDIVYMITNYEVLGGADLGAILVPQNLNSVTSPTFTSSLNASGAQYTALNQITAPSTSGLYIVEMTISSNNSTTNPFMISLVNSATPTVSLCSFPCVVTSTNNTFVFFTILSLTAGTAYGYVINIFDAFSGTLSIQTSFRFFAQS